MNRMLLSLTNQQIVDICGDDPYETLTEEVSHHDSDEAFSHIYIIMIFVASLWFVGKLFTRLAMPSLVGEIIFGMIMGPHCLNLVGSHASDFLIVIGEIGLIMLVVEAGIDVDIGMLSLIGPRGLAIAIFGSIIPVSMGFIISIFCQQSIQASIAIGSCFGPTSMGIALNVLKKAKILNTPTGQLIIAAAILDDVIALIILSELTAMKHPSVKNILLPLIVSPILILIIGYLAINYIPKLIKKIMKKIPEQHHENSILALLFCSTFLLIPACHFVGSSHLLGAFLSGLMFCTDHTIHHVWSYQIKRILGWMLRIFFACTIGFAIPIQDFTSIVVIKRGLLYCICMLGKLITGVFGRPLNKKEFLTIGFSMSAWGEFAFIIATASYAESTIDQESFSSILLAVLLSVIISPYVLSFVIKFYEKQAQKQMDQTLAKYENKNLHPVYFAINTKARGQWGHQDKILHEIFKLSFEIIDFRSWHAPEYNHSHHRPLTKESFYVMDTNLLLPPTKHLSQLEKQKLKAKVKQIRIAMKTLLGNKSVVSCKRWLPGVLEQEDRIDKKDNFFGQKVNIIRRPSYCRREAFKQAHCIMSSFDGFEWDYEKEKNLQNQPELAVPVPSNSNLNELAGPLVIQAAQSVPNVAQPCSPTKHFGKHLLARQLSAPKMEHSGMGHGGQAKGVGALPFTNKMINIHDHWEQENNNLEDAAEESDSDVSISLIYGDEDAQHHKLPEYQRASQSLSAVVAAAGGGGTLKYMEQQHALYIRRPNTIVEDDEEMNDMTNSKKVTVTVTPDTNSHSHHSPPEIEIVTTVMDVNGDELENSYDNHFETPTDEQEEEHIAITVTEMGGNDNIVLGNNISVEKIEVPSRTPSPGAIDGTNETYAD